MKLKNHYYEQKLKEKQERFKKRLAKWSRHHNSVYWIRVLTATNALKKATHEEYSNKMYRLYHKSMVDDLWSTPVDTLHQKHGPPPKSIKPTKARR